MMNNCCALNQPPRIQRRINGIQLPLHCLQVAGWFVIVITAIIIFVILVPIQFYELRITSIAMYSMFYVLHTVSHITAMLIDPSENELRRRKINNVPEFDRSLHIHVIENGRCHLCNINTSSQRTKHCSLCNKCVYNFDHHCKWLNNCIGRRNYASFIMCVTTALLLALYTTGLCVADIILFFINPQKLSTSTRIFLNCSKGGTNVTLNYEYDLPLNCKNILLFLIFLVILGLIALVITGALLHLLLFHIYINILGVSTYEYLVNNKSGPHQALKNTCTIFNCVAKLKNKRKHNEKTDEETPSTSRNSTQNKVNKDQNVGNIINALLDIEIKRTRNLFLYNKSKVHPHENA